MSKKVKMVCCTCGGENVQRQADAAWCVETQSWELVQTFDEAYCQDCDERTKIDCKEMISPLDLYR